MKTMYLHDVREFVEWESNPLLYHFFYSMLNRLWFEYDTASDQWFHIATFTCRVNGHCEAAPSRCIMISTNSLLCPQMTRLSSASLFRKPQPRDWWASHEGTFLLFIIIIREIVRRVVHLVTFFTAYPPDDEYLLGAENVVWKNLLPQASLTLWEQFVPLKSGKVTSFGQTTFVKGDTIKSFIWRSSICSLNNLYYPDSEWRNYETALSDYITYVK